MSVLILMEVTFQPGKAEEGTELFNEFLDQTRTREGCEEIHIYVDRADGSSAVLIELWSSKDLHDAYLAWRGSRPEDGERMKAVLAAPPSMRVLDPAA
jgi:heme oxygenase (mycobilin-producing)